MRWPDIAKSSSKFPFILFFHRDSYILSALDDQSLKFSKVMSVQSAIFNSLFSTGQKINIAVSLISNIRALAVLSRCSLELSMGVSTISICVYYTQFEMHVLIEFIFSPHTFQNNHRLYFKHHKHLNITTEAEYEILIKSILHCGLLRTKRSCDKNNCTRIVMSI